MAYFQSEQVQEDAQSPSPLSLLLLRSLIVAGLVALAVFVRWTVLTALSVPGWIALLLWGSIGYLIIQVASAWILYWSAARTAAPPRPSGLTVDVFHTVYNEEHSLIETAVAAGAAMRGEHRTWLLDDSASPDLAALARRCGAGYLVRPDRKHAKAGNLNAALSRTSGDLIAIFDIDHIPDPAFLEQAVGHFSDPSVGFVQVMITFSNEQQSWIARAASEASLDFYNATSLGMDALGSTTMMGSNSIIRRTALESIGGYRPGLAEDLATSIALHAAGWESRYVAQPLAPGLAPPDLTAWFTQQIKWARGVFEVLLTDYPRLLPRLTPAERLCYLMRMTKYWIGPFVFGHLAATFLLLWLQPEAAVNVFNQYVLHITPFVALDLCIRSTAMRLWCRRQDKGKSLRAAIILIYSSFPVYMTAWCMALLRIPLKFRATPKGPSGHLTTAWRIPIMAALLAFGGALMKSTITGEWSRHPFFMTFAVLETLPIIAMFYHSLRLGTPAWSRWLARADEDRSDAPDAADRGKEILMAEQDLAHVTPAPVRSDSRA